MFGYIEPDRSQLKVAEIDVYDAYYCGLCKEVGENYGQITRRWLTSDMVFLPLFVGALKEQEEQIEREHCVIHPLKKKPVEKSEQAIKYAADIMIIMRGEKFMDDVRDGEASRMRGRLARIARKYDKAANLHIHVARTINENMQKLYALEQNGISNVKEMCTCYGNVIRAMYTGTALPENQMGAVAMFADNLGKLLYLMDISDDFTEDVRERRFNPLHDLGIKDRKKAMELVIPATDHYYEELLKAYAHIDLKKNRELIDNIVKIGLKQKIEEVIRGR